LFSRRAPLSLLMQKTYRSFWECIYSRHASILLAVPVGKIPGGSRNFKLLLVGNAATLIVFTMFYFSGNLIELAFVSMMFGAISAVVLPLSTSMASESMSAKGKAMGIFQTSYDAGGFFGPVIAGAIADYSIQHVFFAITPIVRMSFVLIFIISRISRSKSLLGKS
ncbi:MAG TPA: MFS transporter, partial [Methanotrichaceae archaeon]|nr:MFS transporter [Methanotrichaceae archaeon]